jgi:hypothetical protein
MKPKDLELIFEKHTNNLKTQINTIEYIEPTVRDFFSRCLDALKLQVMVDTIDFSIKELEEDNIELIKKIKKP